MATIAYQLAEYHSNHIGYCEYKIITLRWQRSFTVLSLSFRLGHHNNLILVIRDVVEQRCKKTRDPELVGDIAAAFKGDPRNGQGG